MQFQLHKGGKTEDNLGLKVNNPSSVSSAMGLLQEL